MATVKESTTLEEIMEIMDKRIKDLDKRCR